MEHGTERVSKLEAEAAAASAAAAAARRFSAQQSFGSLRESRQKGRMGTPPPPLPTVSFNSSQGKGREGPAGQGNRVLVCTVEPLDP